MKPDPEGARQSPARLRALRATGLVGAPTSAGLDRLTRLASRLLGTPVSFFSLVDADRDFYVSQTGFGGDLAVTRELRGRTLCHYALRENGALVIGDTHADPDYRAVPTVETLGVRAYLGVPVRHEDEVVGSLCAIDTQPRRWSARDVDTLKGLAEIAQREVMLLAAVGEGVRRSEAAEAQARQLEIAARASSEVLNAVSHDLRSPLSSLVLALGIVEPLVAGDARGARAIQIARRQAAHMRTRLDDLMDNARLAEGTLRLAPAETDVGALLQDTALDFSTAAESAGIALEVSVPGDLPRVVLDPVRMGQVLSNLVSNALKFTPQGGCVELSAHATPHSLVVEVADNGCGVEPETVQKIFEPFWQAAPGQHSGIGLGLHIVKSLVGLHGGRVAVDRSPSGGALFRIELPLVARPHGTAQ